MRATLYFPACLLMCAIANVPASELRIQLADVPTNGSVRVSVYDSANAFVDLRAPTLSLVVPPGAASVTVSNLPPGTYAVVLFDDANGNGVLDKNFIGLPREPLGFSNGYWPEGPPSFSRAAFALGPDESRAMDFRLRPVFGSRGLIGVGVGVITKTSPYRGSDSAVVRPIPAISYLGDRLQVFGPSLSVGLVRSDRFGLAATAAYRVGAYEEDDSDYLEGLGDRRDTLMGGLSARFRGPAGLVLRGGYEHDLFDRVGGGLARAQIGKAVQRGSLTVTPQIGAEWVSDELAAYEFGVPADRARPGREAYNPGSAWNLEAGLSVFVELSGKWRLILSGSVQKLDDGLSSSPIVDADFVGNSFAAFARLL